MCYHRTHKNIGKTDLAKIPAEMNQKNYIIKSEQNISNIASTHLVVTPKIILKEAKITIA